MTASLRRIGSALLALSVLGLLVGYAPAIISCPSPADCAAMLSIYYPGDAPEVFPTAIQSEFMSGSTAQASTYSPIALAFEVVQVTSLYVVLLAVLVLVALEFRELHYLKLLTARRLKQK